MQQLPSHIYLCSVQAADVPAVRALISGVLQEYGLQPDPTGTDADLEQLPESYTSGGGCFFVYKEAATHKIIGTGGLYALKPGQGEIRKMYLLPEGRGKGLGRYMLQQLLQYARENSFYHLELETASVLKEAIALYKSVGFTPRPACPAASRCDQVFELAL